MKSITACKSGQGIIKLVKLNLLLFLIFWGIRLVEQPAPAAAQTVQWSSQQRIPGYLDTTRPPILVADSMGVVHAFTYQEVSDLVEGEEIGIIYSTWSFESGWTLPNDIILSPIRRQARVMDVHLDGSGLFHLVFYGGDEQGANIYYSTARVTEARAAQAWSTPKIIGERALTPSLASIIGDEIGNLVVVFSSNLDGPGLFTVHSTDNGASWSGPEPCFLTYNSYYRADELNLSLSETNDRVHMVWSIVDDVGNKIAGYYARLEVGTAECSGLREIDQSFGIDRGNGVANTSVIEHNDEIIVAYNNGIPPDGPPPPTMWVRSSKDGGSSWSERIRISGEHVGRNGPASFAVDSGGQLHAFFGMRRPSTAGGAISGMWHFVWGNGYWLEAKPVVAGPGSSSFDPSAPNAVIVQGNKLLVTWFTDPGARNRGVWYSAAELDTPALSALPLSGTGGEDRPANTFSSIEAVSVVTDTAGQSMRRSIETDTEPVAANQDYSEAVLLPIVIVMAFLIIILGSRKVFLSLFRS